MRFLAEGPWPLRGSDVRIFLVNLDRHPERLSYMRGVLHGLELDFERISAVDRRQLPGDIAPARSRMTAGEIACAQSHFRCWQRLLATGDEQALILEDDVLISPLLRPVLAVADGFPRDAHLIRFETRCLDVELADHGYDVGRELKLQRIYSAHPGTAGYVITRRGAAHLLAQRWPDLAIDDAIFEPKSPLFRHLVIYQANPGLVIQLDVWKRDGVPSHFRSDLEAERERMVAARTRGAFRYAADKLDSLVKDIRKFAVHRCLSRFRGRHMQRIDFAEDAAR
jgi:glycosyl transferase, family 25